MSKILLTIYIVLYETVAWIIASFGLKKNQINWDTQAEEMAMQ